MGAFDKGACSGYSAVIDAVCDYRANYAGVCELFIFDSDFTSRMHECI